MTTENKPEYTDNLLWSNDAWRDSHIGVERRHGYIPLAMRIAASPSQFSDATIEKAARILRAQKMGRMADTAIEYMMMRRRAHDDATRRAN